MNRLLPCCPRRALALAADADGLAGARAGLLLCPSGLPSLRTI
jgi:hypothetical protein